MSLTFPASMIHYLYNQNIGGQNDEYTKQKNDDTPSN